MVIIIRAFSEKDLPELVELLNEEKRGSFEFIPISAEEALSRINGGKFRVLMAESRGKVVGSVAYNDGFWGEEIRWLTAKDTKNGESVREQLVEAAEKYVQKGSAFAAEDLGSPRIRLWESLGYSISGGLYQMTARLTNSRSVPSVPSGITLRSMKPNEESSVAQTVNTVFQWERLKSDFLEKGKIDSPPFDEEWIHLAECQRNIVSVVIAWPATKYNLHFHERRGYLGPAATVAEFQGKKLASALTTMAMNFLFEKGFDTAVLHTSELNVPSMTLLRNVGFEVAYQWKFLKKNLQKTTE